MHTCLEDAGQVSSPERQGPSVAGSQPSGLGHGSSGGPSWLSGMGNDDPQYGLTTVTFEASETSSLHGASHPVNFIIS